MSGKHTEFIRESIMRDMSEGVMAIGMDGVINYINPAAAQILDRDMEELTGRKFVRCFFGQEENDAFNQAILDAIRQRDGDLAEKLAHEHIIRTIENMNREGL